MRIAWSDAKILCGILLLSLRYVGASVFSVVNTSRRLPFRLLGQSGNSFNGVTDGQVMNKANCLLPHHLHSIDWPKLSQIFTNFLFRDVFWKVAQIYIPRGARLLDSEGNRCWYLGGLAPPDFNVISFHIQLLEYRIGVEVSGRAAVKEGNEGAAFVWKHPYRLNLTAAHVAQKFFCCRIDRNIAEVDCATRSRHDAWSHLHGHMRIKTCPAHTTEFTR